MRGSTTTTRREEKERLVHMGKMDETLEVLHYYYVATERNLRVVVYDEEGAKRWSVRKRKRWYPERSSSVPVSVREFK